MAQPQAYDAPALTISAAARLAGMHPQTLRQYDRLGIVTPRRARGRGRRYSMRDVDVLLEVQRLSGEGVNLAGIKRILELQDDVAQLRAVLEQLRAAIDPGSRVFAASASGDVVAVPRGRRPERAGASAPQASGRGALVIWGRRD
ncbi:transcriptional regulator, MerR family [Beutenbergia cavernae DSM 12333]|uniref:Transcriptional regulator, MerR family n=1 Tax=Beutenbergia cavernae (strain ATCC BAA-8 / DSM 12333 / CCUG 43141 / JCM 11478 / NBRC 16432 / NCIMB 13614 / HKI 0122) TaxID=471853 RepID=C5C3N9_BEUC1|nr:MerR family transcriptional regulator [Beutenbergia cavernae]ACQ81948.1 transcriptional regulator, MerR family [Beutenbergia cavernae DSM 12333]